MWAVCELRQGDILQTHGLFRNKLAAMVCLTQWMDENAQPSSWWKMVEVLPNVQNPNLQAGDQCRICVWCNWEDDNAVDVLGVFGMEQDIPNVMLGNASVWTDDVVLM